MIGIGRTAITLAAFCGTLFVGIPAAVHYYQPEEFLFAAVELLAVGLALATALFAIGLAILWLLPRLRRPVVAAYDALTITLIGVGLVFPIASGPITGSEDAISLFATQNLLQATGLVGAVLALLVLFWRSHQISDAALRAALVVLVGFTLFVAAANTDFGYPARLDDAERKADLAVLSPEKNIVVVLMDELTSYVVEQVFLSDSEIRDQFDGFTFYANTTSTAS